jgi:hypothetical protein
VRVTPGNYRRHDPDGEGLALLSRLTPEAALRSIVLPMVVLGTRMGPDVTIFMIAMQNSGSSEFRGIVTSVNVFSRNLGSAIGVSLQGAVLIAVLTPQLELHGAARSVESVRGLDPRGTLDIGLNGLGLAERGSFRRRFRRAPTAHSSWVCPGDIRFCIGLAARPIRQRA